MGGSAWSETHRLIDENVCFAVGILATNPLTRASSQSHMKAERVFIQFPFSPSYSFYFSLPHLCVSHTHSFLFHLCSSNHKNRAARRLRPLPGMYAAASCRVGFASKALLQPSIVDPHDALRTSALRHKHIRKQPSKTGGKTRLPLLFVLPKHQPQTTGSLSTSPFH